MTRPARAATRGAGRVRAEWRCAECGEEGRIDEHDDAVGPAEAHRACVWRGRSAVLYRVSQGEE